MNIIFSHYIISYIINIKYKISKYFNKLYILLKNIQLHLFFDDFIQFCVLTLKLLNHMLQ